MAGYNFTPKEVSNTTGSGFPADVSIPALGPVLWIRVLPNQALTPSSLLSPEITSGKEFLITQDPR